MTQRLLSLFALTNHPEFRIARIPVTRELQEEISQVFLLQEEQFHFDIEETIKFDGKYRPDENELLFIDDFDDVDGLLEAIQNPSGYPELEISSRGMEAIRAIFCGYVNNGSSRILIQCFDKKRIISASGFSIFHSGDTFRKFDGSGLTLDNKLTAILDGNVLKFASFHFVRRVFDMSGYYKEATNQDLIDFCNHSALIIENQEEFRKISDSWIRRKVGLIQQSGILDRYLPSQIAEVAKLFSIDINILDIGGQIKISLPMNRQEIKRILRFLDEDYYEAPLTTTRYLSNSKRMAD